MTLAPTYETIKRKTSGNPLIRKKTAEFLLGTGHECKDGLLPSIKCNVVRCGDILLGL
jgi:hypothetical protein